MLSQQLLDLVRCPMNPSRTRLRPEQDHLVCEQCAVKFAIQDGFPVLVIEEATLPPGCDSIAQLPCQRAGAELR
jgi:uncharacterized protein YbaR (Trm112 family)